MPHTPARIGVIIAPLGHDYDSRALKYLILHQNTEQQSFEFQLLPTLGDGDLIARLSHDKTPKREEIEDAMPGYLSGYRASLAESEEEYDLKSNVEFPIVILSTATFEDNYYFSGGDDWAIISLGNWQHVMAPPSIVEFFLSLLVRASIDFACGDNYPHRHIATRGCSFDFAADLDNLRFSILTGYLCSECVASICAGHSEQLASDAATLLQKTWLGTVSKPSDAAVTAKKLGHDLFHTKGVTQTWWERTRSTLEEEAVKTVLKICALIIGTGLLIWLGLKSAP